MAKKLSGSRILITGGAGFIGSNLCEYFLHNNNEVICFDNLSTGKLKNIEELSENSNFKFIKGDICNFDTCKDAIRGVEYVFHQAALGSIPRSIEDPINTNKSNIDGFLNMLVASKEAGVSRFIYAASASTYGDSNELPKIEDRIGAPLSPYAVTKYVNELYARVFWDLYGLETIGLRYFNVFGRKQDPNGAYAAVIPLWIKSMLNHKQPVINGDGSYSRDFTYIDNVIQANELAATTTKDEFSERVSQYNHSFDKCKTFEKVFNVGFGGNTTLNELFETLRDNLARYDAKIANIQPIYLPPRFGDIPHSMASIEKTIRLLDYNPKFDLKEGIKIVCEWYYCNLQG